MKRLLLPLLAALTLPTAINAFPWNSEIVVKTDLVTDKYLKHFERKSRRDGEEDER